MDYTVIHRYRQLIHKNKHTYKNTQRCYQLGDLEFERVTFKQLYFTKGLR